MSPASPDGLHVERYIGSYLISSGGSQVNNGRKPPPPPPPQNYPPYGYAGVATPFRPAPFCQNQNSWAGVPLISTVNRRNRRPHPNHHPRLPMNHHHHHHHHVDFGGEPQQLPLSRLALHTRGVPLILARRYNNNNNNNNNNRKPNHCINNNNYKNYANPVAPRPATSDFALKKLRDALPKDNEESSSSSSSSASHSSVPDVHRVLNIDSLSVTSDESSGSANSETCLPRIIKPRKRRKKDRKPPSSPQSGKADAAKPSSEAKAPAEQQQAEVAKSSKSVDEDDDDLSSLFEAISRCSPTVCECKYCDASEQIWDFDRFCYSSLFSSESDLSKEGSSEPDKDSALRRSWSEPCSGGYTVESLRTLDSKSDQDVFVSTSSDFGAIGTGRHGSRLQRDSSENKDWKAITVPQSPERVPDILFKCFPSRGVSLEVSPSIVTSVSGHRDLEIKFFSTNDEITKKGYQCDAKDLQPVAVQ